MKNIHLEPLGNGIEIYVSDSYHFSTDTILLADFSLYRKLLRNGREKKVCLYQPVCSNCVSRHSTFSLQKGRKKCAELGTGCGTIPLLWLRHNKNLEIDAVEIQSDACALAQKSVEYNNLGDKINIVNADLKELKGILPFGCYDLVVCNPPYKIGGGGITNPESAKQIARHETECTLDDICFTASKLLQFGGSFCICQRPERLVDVMESMRKFSIEPKTLRLVQQRTGKAPKLFLLEGRRGGKRGFLNVLPTLFIEDENGDFSEEMMKIYGCYKTPFEELK